MNILTFDLEEWFHIINHDDYSNVKSWSNFEDRLKANTDRILELLDERSCVATFFSLGWVARKHPDVLRSIQSMGHSFASHSDVHKMVANHDREFFKNDLKKSINSIEDVTGEKIIAYRAPGFSITKDCLWAFDEMLNQGIEIDCSSLDLNHAHGGGMETFGNLPSIINVNGRKLKEFPISTGSILYKKVIFSGGGYFRLFPYFFIKKNMESLNYIMTYFHPRDFDFEQPVMKNLDLLRRFKSYYGLGTSLDKLSRLTFDFDFVDLNYANEVTDWSAVDEHFI
jgi:polysaccharide deacetylase family protein (PEP-CTERM system associated)